MDLLPLIESSRFECDASTFNSNVYLAKGNKKMRLLKILLSNNCSLDCSYCPNAWRKGRSITPEKLANAFFRSKKARNC
jgi:predicted DNA-binding helix-hairpin-helix protein